MDTRISIHAHPRYLVTTDAAALILVELLLFIVSRIRVLLSPLAFQVLGVGVLIGFAADVAWWFWKGTRAAEVSEERLTLWTGPTLMPTEIPRSTILRSRIIRRPGSRRVLIRTMSGKRLRISENAFPRDEFTRFLAALEAWAPR
jgi:hypothetical protein